jgi:hypothetical protein
VCRLSVSTEYLVIVCDGGTIFNLVLFQQVCYNNINIKKDTILKRATKSLLEELNSISEKKNSEAIIEARATHVIDSAINLLSLIKENFPPDQAYELERRLINSIKGADSSKFVRSIRKLRDSKEVAKSLTIIDGNLKDED